MGDPFEDAVAAGKAARDPFDDAVAAGREVAVLDTPEVAARKKKNEEFEAARVKGLQESAKYLGTDIEGVLKREDAPHYTKEHGAPTTFGEEFAKRTIQPAVAYTAKSAADLLEASGRGGDATLALASGQPKRAAKIISTPGESLESTGGQGDVERGLNRAASMVTPTNLLNLLGLGTANVAKPGILRYGAMSAAEKASTLKGFAIQREEALNALRDLRAGKQIGRAMTADNAAAVERLISRVEKTASPEELRIAMGTDDARQLAAEFTHPTGGPAGNLEGQAVNPAQGAAPLEVPAATPRDLTRADPSRGYLTKPATVPVQNQTIRLGAAYETDAGRGTIGAVQPNGRFRVDVPGKPPVWVEPGIPTEAPAKGIFRPVSTGPTAEGVPAPSAPTPEPPLGGLGKPDLPIGPQQAAKDSSALQKALGAPQAVLDAGDTILRKTVSEPVKRGIQALVPYGARQAIYRAFQTDAANASKILDDVIHEAHGNIGLERATAEFHERRFANAMSKAGVTEGSDAGRDVYRYVGGEIPWSEVKAPPELQGPADALKAIVKDAHADEVAERVASPESFRQRWDGDLKGLLQRKYDDVKQELGFSGGSNNNTISDLYMRDEGPNLIIKADEEQVAGVLKMHGIDPANLEQVPYLHQIGHETGLRLPNTEEGQMLRLEVAKQFPKDRLLRNSPGKTLEERMALNERMFTGEAVSRTVVSMRRRAEIARANRSLASQIASEESTAANTAQIPMDKKYGEMAGKWVTPDIKDAYMTGVEPVDEGFEFVSGMVDQAKRGIIESGPMAAMNGMGNFQLSIMGGVNPVFNPAAITDWAAFIKDARKWIRGEEITPAFKEVLRHIDTKGLTADLVDEMERSLSLVDNHTLSSREKGRLYGAFLGAAPQMDVKSLGFNANRLLGAGTAAAHGAARGLLMGDPAGAGVEALAGAGSHLINREMVGGWRRMFNLADPTYQGALYYNAVRTGKDPLKALSWAQSFKAEDMPKWANVLMGRQAPKLGASAAGKFGSKTAQFVAKGAGPMFFGFPYNWGRLLVQGAAEKPLSTAIAVGIPYMATKAAWDSLAAKGEVTKEEAAAYQKEDPAAYPVTKNSKGEWVTVDIGRGFAGAEPFTRLVTGFPALGFAPSLGYKGLAAVAASKSGSAKVPEPSGGYETLKAKEADHPLSAIIRFMNEGFGGPYSPFGQASEKVRGVLRGESDIMGRKKSPLDLGIELVTGVKVKQMSKQLQQDRHELDIKYAADKAKDRLFRILASPTTTPAEKARAEADFNKAVEAATKDADKKYPLGIGIFRRPKKEVPK